MITAIALLFLNFYEDHGATLTTLLNIDHVNSIALLCMCILLDVFVIIGTVCIISEIRKENRGNTVGEPASSAAACSLILVENDKITVIKQLGE